jgi:hypothetical protein
VISFVVVTSSTILVMMLLLRNFAIQSETLRVSRWPGDTTVHRLKCNKHEDACRKKKKKSSGFFL